MIRNLIGAGVIILLGISLFGPIKAQTMEINQNQNDSIGYANTMIIQSVPVFFLLAVVGMGVLVAYAGLRGADVTEDNIVELEPKQIEPKQQTYEEYVQERLNVERMMR